LLELLSEVLDDILIENVGSMDEDRS
jgi:hypothetical protein